MQFEPWIVDLIAFIFGAAIGSFLNVVALRTLEARSIVFPPSACPHCDKQIAFYDNIPVLSFLLLRGKCRNCQVKISIQYPLVELITAAMTVLIVWRFGITAYTAGILVLSYTLIAVTITDLKEKLIPHDITYPSIVVGLIFSFAVRNDLLGALSAVGASYLIFDFLAHYGLKAYIKLHAGQGRLAQMKAMATDPALTEGLEKAAGETLAVNEASAEEFEDMEVMGGGDAVLSALIGSYLGWQKLIVALMVGFVVGTIMGLYLLVSEMHKAKILKEAVKPAIIWAAFGATGMCLLLYVLSVVFSVPANSLPWFSAASAGLGAGCLLAVVSVGTRVSRPFPFGPALAIGGFAAILANSVGLFAAFGA